LNQVSGVAGCSGVGEEVIKGDLWLVAAKPQQVLLVFCMWMY
jgi:hypothetical protein